MRVDARDASFIKRLIELKKNPKPGWAEDQLRLMRHYGVYDEMFEYVMTHDQINSGDVVLERIAAFRQKPNRVVWTEEEFREKVREGVISEYDVIRMADGYVPPQDLFA